MLFSTVVGLFLPYIKSSVSLLLGVKRHCIAVTKYLTLSQWVKIYIQHQQLAARIARRCSLHHQDHSVLTGQSLEQADLPARPPQCARLWSQASSQLDLQAVVDLLEKEFIDIR